MEVDMRLARPLEAKTILSVSTYLRWFKMVLGKDTLEFSSLEKIEVFFCVFTYIYLSYSHGQFLVRVFRNQKDLQSSLFMKTSELDMTITYTCDPTIAVF